MYLLFYASPPTARYALRTGLIGSKEMLGRRSGLAPTLAGDMAGAFPWTFAVPREGWLDRHRNPANRLF